MRTWWDSSPTRRRPRTKEQIDKNRGKVIFIDEAYTLYNGPTDMEGRQALDELMRLSEEYRNDTVIVLAGYDEHMERLFSANPGLKSRFRRRLDLPDYTPAEKVQVLDYMMNENGRVFSIAQARKRAAQYAARDAQRRGARQRACGAQLLRHHPRGTG